MNRDTLSRNAVYALTPWRNSDHCNVKPGARLASVSEAKTSFTKSVPSSTSKTFWSGVGGWRDRQLPDGPGFWTRLFVKNAQLAALSACRLATRTALRRLLPAHRRCVAADQSAHPDAS